MSKTNSVINVIRAAIAAIIRTIIILLIIERLLLLGTAPFFLAFFALEGAGSLYAGEPHIMQNSPSS